MNNTTQTYNLQTLAEQFVTEYSNLRLSTQNAKQKLDETCAKYHLETISPLLNNTVHIGTRYIFADASFCDFYLEAPTKIFTGINSPAVKGQH